MPNGYWQKLLRIDLSTGTRSVEPLAEADLRRFIGGAGLGAVHNTTTHGKFVLLHFTSEQEHMSFCHPSPA